MRDARVAAGPQHKEPTMTRVSAVLIPLASGLTLMGLLASGGDVERTIAGSCAPVFDVEVCTWGTAVGDEVTGFGATVPLAMVEHAPMQGEMVFPPVPAAIIPLPAEVARATGFDHLGVNWELHGHPPALFLTPHFDFHFYTITPDEVAAIDCADRRKPAQLPAAYSLPDVDIPDMGTLVGLCVPHMGMHSMPTVELDETTPFGASMLVGYYGQDLVFLEPMISQAKLAQAATFPMAIPALPETQPGVVWPSHFEMVYDAETRAYRLTFSGL
jgi:hypothetical protein